MTHDFRRRRRDTLADIILNKLLKKANVNHRGVRVRPAKTFPRVIRLLLRKLCQANIILAFNFYYVMRAVNIQIT